MNTVSVEFDPNFGVLYVQFRDFRVMRTVELVSDKLFVDLDGHDNVLGIEALGPGMLGSVLCQIPKAYHLPEEAELISFEDLDKAFIVPSL